LTGETIDRIFVNLPFEPVPPEYSYFLHSNGGPDGLKLTREFLRQINQNLLKFNEIRMVTFSLGTGNHMIIEDVIHSEIGSNNFDVEIEVLAPPMEFSGFSERFRDAAKFQYWKDSTLHKGFNSLYFLGVRILPGHKFKCHISENTSRDWGDWSNPVNWAALWQQ
jgi:hypothetical protein